MRAVGACLVMGAHLAQNAARELANVKAENERSKDAIDVQGERPRIFVVVKRCINDS